MLAEMCFVRVLGSCVFVRVCFVIMWVWGLMCLRVLFVSYCVMVYGVVLFGLFVRVCLCVCV